MKNKYLAIVLPEGVRNRVLKYQEPSFETVVAHHITIQFDLTKFSSEEIAEWTGKEHDVYIAGYAENDRVQALVVEVDENYRRPDGKLFHITVSHVDGAQAREANELLADYDNVVLSTPLVPLGRLKAEVINKW